MILDQALNDATATPRSVTVRGSLNEKAQPKVVSTSLTATSPTEKSIAISFASVRIGNNAANITALKPALRANVLILTGRGWKNSPVKFIT
jgi:hypothetical protein